MGNLLLLFGLFFGLMILGMPISFSLGISAMIVLFAGLHVSAPIAASKMLGNINSFAWLAIPLFLFLGNLMTITGITKRLITFSLTLLGHIKGGLSHVSVLTNTLLAGMSGSLSADAAAVGAVFGPSMEKAGYHRGYTAAIVASGSIIGPLIPPSICFILIGIVGNISIVKLFLGGAVPGLIVAITLIVIGYVIAKRRRYRAEEKSTWKQRGKAFVPALPALILPFVIIGGMRFGAFTATEAGAIGVMYAILVGTIVYRETKLSDIWHVFIESAIASGKAFFIIATSGIFGWVLTMLRAPDTIMGFMGPSLHPLQFMFVVYIIFTILGCFIDGTVLILIFIPLLVPVAKQMGIDLVYFGVMFGVTNLIGALTPPMAVAMFISCAVTGASVEEYIKEGWPLIVSLFVINIVLILLPQLTLFLPNVIIGK